MVRKKQAYHSVTGDTKEVNDEKNRPLKNLGGPTSFDYTAPDKNLLEWFDNPFADAEKNSAAVTGTVQIEAPEFTCLCPITGQPDYATILIDYEPDQRCLESKSLKLYLAGYRMHGIFHEALINKIANELVTLLKPRRLKVEGRFNARGGITFWPVAQYHKP